jgi:aspartate aminotransferase-like enzyme
MSNAVTAINVPAGLDGEKMVETMKDKYGVTIAGGQAELKGKVFRAAHMGFINKDDIILALSTMERVLDEMGYFTQHPNIKKGAGVAAAKKVLG